LIDTAVEKNIIVKSGSWFSYKEDRIGQGRDSVKVFLQGNPKVASEIDTELRKQLGLTSEEPKPAAEKAEKTGARAPEQKKSKRS
jgi:recombination protein RecA